MSESSIPAKGPGPMLPNSTTFTPASGPMARGCHVAPDWRRRATATSGRSCAGREMRAAMTVDVPPRTIEHHTVVMDEIGRVRIPRGGANVAAALRIGLGLLYLWAFLAQ